MKSLYIAHAVVVLAGGTTIFFLAKPDTSPAPTPTPTVTTATADGMKLTTATDPTHVFQKAFWRRPTREDQILHAERREWSTADGLQKWQWFIAVDPGPQLLEYLGTNPFALATNLAAGDVENPPEWFPHPSAGFQIQQNTEGRFTLMLSANHEHLYATDSGSGFTAPSSTP